MADAVRQLLPIALVLSVSPLPIIEMILVLFSRRAVRNGVVFLISVAGVTYLVPFVLAGLVSVATDDTTSEPARFRAWLLVAVAVTLLGLAVMNWRNRSDHTVPAILDRITDMGVAAVLVLALGATLLNPKNLMLMVAAGTELGSLQLGPAQRVVPLAIFTVIATIPLWGSLLYLAFGGERARQRLEVVKEWLLVNNRLIMAVVLALLGVVVLVNGITSL